MYMASEKKPQDVLIAIGFIALILLMILSKLGIVTIEGANLSGSSSTSTASRSTRSGGSTRNLTPAQEIKKNEKAAIEAGKSIWDGKITLSRGNASSEFQPYKEYIVISGSRLKDEKVNIAGWTLTNARGTIPYQLNDGRVYYPSDSVTIPGAARLFVLDGVNSNSPVVLEKGSKVTVITGSLANNSNKYLNVSGFQINQCSGYVEKLPQFDFQPKLTTSRCPDPEDEVDVRGLEKSCRAFVEGMPRCHTPEFDTRTIIKGERQRDCVDGVCGLTTQCRVMLENTFSYNACVARHSSEPDFLTKEWRVYLNNKWELWAKRDETIRLFDNEGKVVDEISW